MKQFGNVNAGLVLLLLFLPIRTLFAQQYEQTGSLFKNLLEVERIGAVSRADHSSEICGSRNINCLSGTVFWEIVGIQNAKIIFPAEYNDELAVLFAFGNAVISHHFFPVSESSINVNTVPFEESGECTIAGHTLVFRLTLDGETRSFSKEFVQNGCNSQSYVDPEFAVSTNELSNTVVRFNYESINK